MRTAIISFVLLLVALGCKRNNRVGATADDYGHSHAPGGHSHPADESHEAEEKTAQITVWTGRYEIFAEHKAVVARKPTQFITHVSDMTTGEPRRAGLIRFVLEQGGTKFEHPQAGPARPGIYLPAISFPSEGEWRATVIIPDSEQAAIELGTIKVYPNAEAAAKAEFPEPPEGISFLKEQQWRIRAKSEAAQKRTLVKRMPLNATVIPAPGSKATVFSTVIGTLLANSHDPKLGVRVKAGEPLAWVQPAFGEFTTRLIDAEADAIRTKAALEQAETFFQRTKALFDQQAKSERELKESEVALRTAKASYEAASAVQNLYKNSGATFEGGTVRIGIVAPIDGFLDRVLATPGSRVTPEEPVFAIVNPNAAFVQAHVPETRLREIDSQVESVFTPLGSTNAFPLKFLALGREVDPTTRAIPLTFEFISGQPLPLGSAGTLLMGSAIAVEAVAVPSEAVVDEDGIPVVFAHVSGETYQKRDIQLGIRDGDWIEIKSGIAEGERVATDGAYAILLSTKSGVIPAHGHAH